MWINLKKKKEGRKKTHGFSRTLTHLLQNFVDVHRVSLFSFSLSFGFFLTRALRLLFRYIVGHFFPPTVVEIFQAVQEKLIRISDSCTGVL